MNQYWRDAIALAEATWGPNHPFTAAILCRFASTLDDEDRYAEAEPLYRRALTIRRTRLEPDDPSIGSVLQDLAANLTLQGKVVEAEPYYREALSILDRPHGNQALLVTTLNNLGRDLNDQGVAERAQSKILAAQGKPTDAQAAMQNSQQHLKDAESVLRRALSITENTAGARSVDTAVSLENLAANLASQGRAPEANVLSLRAKGIKDSLSDAQPPQIAQPLAGPLIDKQATAASSIPPDIRMWSHEEEAEVERIKFAVRDYERNGDFRTAEYFLRKRLDICESSWGPAHPMTARALVDLGNSLNHQGRFAEAEANYRRALNIDEHREGVNPSDVALDAGNLATSLNSLGRFAEAESLLRKALEVDERLSPKSTAVDLSNLAVNLDFQGRYSDAEPFFRRALASTQSLSKANDPRVAETINNLAYNLDAQRRYTEAEPYYQRALWIFQANPARQSDIGLALDNLGVNLDAQKRHVEAEPFHREALRVLEYTAGPTHVDTAATLNNLAAFPSSRSKCGMLFSSVFLSGDLWGAVHPSRSIGKNLCTANARFPLQLR